MTIPISVVKTGIQGTTGKVVDAFSDRVIDYQISKVIEKIVNNKK